VPLIPILCSKNPGHYVRDGVRPPSLEHLGMSISNTKKIQSLPEQRPFNRSAKATALLLERIVLGIYRSRQSNEVQQLQWSILRYLENAAQRQKTIGQIASYLGLTHAPVARAVNVLIERKLVAKVRNPNDGRSQIVSLTSEGLKILDTDPIHGIAAEITQLPVDVRHLLNDLLTDLIMKESSETEGDRETNSDS